MKVVFDWLLDNWQFVLFVAFCFVELLLLIFKKNTKLDTIKEKILEILPLCISLAEEFLGAGNGEKKKEFCLKLAHSFISFSDSYDDFVASAIEKILSTPEKK